MKIKICGINDVTFAAEAERLGVDYLGFIFASSSPRYVTVDQAKAIVAGLNGHAIRVGVFVRQTTAEIIDVMTSVGLQVVQLHRRASGDDVLALRNAGYEVWTLAGGAPGDGVLFDSSHGDGETVLRPGDYKTILAGGLSAANLQEAIATGADVLDFNSSLETSPGVKSLDRLHELLPIR